MIRFFTNFFIHTRFFLAAGLVALLFILAFPFPILFPLSKGVLIILGITLIVDILILFNRSLRFSCGRNTSQIMSLGSQNPVTLELLNESNMEVHARLIDELPYQLQLRENEHKFRIGGRQKKIIEEHFRPTTRGEYQFGNVRLFISSRIGLIERRITFDQETAIPVYPSVIDMKKYELRASSKLALYYGMKKIRRIGLSYEFEQISEYSVGDNYQSMNWKATSKVGQLMVNKYTDEKSQAIYCLIDKSRYMKMPFQEITLLDHAINTSLVISNSALKKDDKAGLITFSDQVETFIKADKKRTQLRNILHALYKEEETRIEANYELMYTHLRKSVPSRSLFFLFSNFDTVFALERVLPVLRKISKTHLLCVIVFENTELEEFQDEVAENELEIYEKTIARKVNFEKRLVINQLKQHAINVVYTRPEHLSINVLNKYLELKARGKI